MVFTAPPDHHLLVNPDETLSLSQGPKVNYARPAADPLFESAAACLGPRLIAVVLTGGESDGSLGVQFVKQHRGIVIAQNAASSEKPNMPLAAIKTGAVDYILPLDEIALALVRLVSRREGS